VKILNIVPTLDTGVGMASARGFEKETGDPSNVVAEAIGLAARHRR